MKNVALIVLSLFVINVYAQSGSKNFIDQPYVEITGTAEMEIVPDEIYLNIVVSEGDDKAKQSLTEKEKAMVSSMKTIGIDTKEDLQIVDFASNFSSYFLKKSDIVGTKEYQLIVHDAKILAKLYVEMKKLNISNITIVKVDHSEMDKYKQQVKVDAIKAGKAKASYLAQAMDQSVGKALFVQESNYMPYRQQMPSRANVSMSMAVMEQESEFDGSEISFEKIKLNSSMLIRFELKE